MHIFFITQWFPTPSQPYYGIFILEHAQAVAKKHTVSVLHIQGIDPGSYSPVSITSRPDIPGIDVYQLSYQHPKLPYTTWLRQLSGAFKVFQKASQAHGRPDVIHANIWNTAAAAILLGRRAGIPVVLSEHSSAYARKLLTTTQVRQLRFFMNRIDLILPVCDALGRKLHEYGIHRPMLAIPNVADPDVFYPAAPGEMVANPYREIVLIARLSQEKAVHLAIQATGRLHQAGITYHLHIAGDGPERPRLEALVAELGLSGWVHFHGYLPKDGLAALLRRASIFMLTSLWENLPVVVLEALTSGLPVVAPAVGGIPEVITPACGRVFSPGDLDDLCIQLTAVFRELATYDPQAIRAYAIGRFSPQVVGDQLDKIYMRLVEDRHAFAASAVS